MSFYAEHEKSYDALAIQYEARASVLRPVTEESLHHFRLAKPTGRILDVGCGVGIAAAVLSEWGYDVVGIDVSTEMIVCAEKRAPAARLVRGDYMGLLFPGTFDGIIAFAFIHLFPKDMARLVLAKIRADLDDDGVLYIGTTREAESRDGWEAKEDYEEGPDGLPVARWRARYTEDEFVGLLESAGFEVVYREHVDPFEKRWMDVLCRKAPDA